VVSNPRDRETLRGFTLVEVIISSIILVIAAGALLSLTSQSLGMHRRGEQKIVAASILDDLLSRVLTEGAQDFTSMYPSRGFCEEPFTTWEYEVEIGNSVGLDPYQVTARVTSPTGRNYECATLVAPRLGEEPNPIRAPDEPVDREERWAEIKEEL
jgi:prepilin-type N-terminal cleavage/methylation domain-containing protein